MGVENVNCIIVDDDLLSRTILEDFIKRTDSLKLIASCENAIQASNELSKSKIDVIFLDVEMPEMTGIELIQTLKEKPEIVIVSSNEKYAVEAFEYEVADYLVKPVNYPRFLKCINKLTDRNKDNSDMKVDHNTFFVKVDQRLLGLKLNEIQYIEALADYVMIFTEKGRFTVYSSMKGVEGRLQDKDFIRVHRSFIVNKNKIDSIEDNMISVAGKAIPVGVTYKEKLMSSLNML